MNKESSNMPKSEQTPELSVATESNSSTKLDPQIAPSNLSGSKEQDIRSWREKIADEYQYGAISKEEAPVMQGALNSLSELIRTLSRASNKHPEAFETHDMERLERAKKSLRESNWAHEPMIIRSTEPAPVMQWVKASEPPELINRYDEDEESWYQESDYVLVQSAHGILCKLATWNGDKWYLHGEPSPEESITHWMPLPPSPQGTEAGIQSPVIQKEKGD
jgi:hypothetical protein